MQALLMGLIEKYLGRYFLAYAMSYVAFWGGKLSQENFMWVTVAYFTGGAVTAVSASMKPKDPSP